MYNRVINLNTVNIQQQDIQILKPFSFQIFLCPETLSHSKTGPEIKWYAISDPVIEWFIQDVSHHSII
jgi:hypothetical protein